MREAVIVSTARTPIGKAYRGAFNDTLAQKLRGHVVREAVRRARLEPGEIEEVVPALPFKMERSASTSHVSVPWLRGCRRASPE